MIIMNDPTMRQIYANAIGELAVSYLEHDGCSAITSIAESRALTAIFQIKGIIGNNGLNESDRYEHIAAIVESFYCKGFGMSYQDEK